MDPLTVLAGVMEVASLALTLGNKIWDATPKDLQTTEAGDWAKFAHNISEVILSAQKQINALIIPQKAA